ncbi:MAG: GNAT family N-acetyltransferase [Lactobacillus sp.]|nr:GNAT family N-acetyltransferase [Lactobacillus sp.]MDN6052165.1 GNAT family N-acetyltransferase [Lactobacillus sp.]
MGLVRTVGDNQTILYVQDILVDPHYQRRGIGMNLMKQVMAKHQNIRQKVLLTDDTVATRSFYRKCGFTETSELNLVSFYREF